MKQFKMKRAISIKLIFSEKKWLSKFLLPVTLTLTLLIPILLTGCSKNSTDSNEITTKKPVVVATMLDSEGSVLGRMILRLLKENNIETVDKINFGTPDILRQALENKEVDLVVDYTGSGQYYHPDETADPSIWHDSQKGYDKVAELDKTKNNLIWLTPAKANNTEMIAVREEFVKEKA